LRALGFRAEGFQLNDWEKAMAGLAESFQAYGAKLKNPRWSWSARTPDNKVVMTFWKDRLNYSTKPVSYSNFGSPTLLRRRDQPGNRERIENLKWAHDHCDGLMYVVIVVAIDVNAEPREIAESFPQTRLLMKLTELNEETGEFRAINVGT
jgi:hypothetical protein